MSDACEGLHAGTFSIPAQERIVHGMPAGAAVRAEAERLGAQRAFLISISGRLSSLELYPCMQMSARRRASTSPSKPTC